MHPLVYDILNSEPVSGVRRPRFAKKVLDKHSLHHPLTIS